MARFIPFIFVLLWSTGFIGAKFGLPYAEPFTLLMWRMLIVVPLFALLVLIFKRPGLGIKDATIQGLVGLLIHGAYLGCVFAAIYRGVPTGLAALIVSMNPLLVGALSGWVLDKQTTYKEWLSLITGLIGVMIVLWGAASWEGVITATNLAWLSLALGGICAGTLIQKRFAQQVDLITGSAFQYAAALVFFAAMSFTLETGNVQWTPPFIATLAWLIIVLSLVAVLLLMYMIRHGEATRVSSYFYLVPPITAIQGWAFFDETWSWTTFAGAVLVVLALAMNRSK
jgi:drug/metabolite transporter (DMT)-like permease